MKMILGELATEISCMSGALEVNLVTADSCLPT